MKRLLFRLSAAALFSIVAISPALAQDDDGAFRPAEPDYTLVSLPTSLRLPKFGSAFRVTHRFLRPLGEGNFGDLLDDAFGLDNGAAIGLEFRFGIVPHGQIGVHRTSFGKTIELFAEYGVLQQASSLVDVTAWASLEGLDNLEGSKSPALGAIVSRRFGEWAAFYVQPVWVNNSNVLPSELVDDNDTFLLGLGTRLRVRPTVYLVAEWAPRVAGYAPDTHHASFAIEKAVGGHVFQLNFSDSVATTMGQLARGGADSSDWYLGFNLSRKFF